MKVILFILLTTAFCIDYAHELDPEIPKEVPMITELWKSSKKGLEDERRKTMDRQVVVVTFRDAYVKEKGLITLVNEFNQVLANSQSIKPIEYV